MLLSRILSISAAATLRETRPPTDRSSALPAEHHLSEFLAKALDLLRIRCRSKAFRKFEEGLLFSLFGLKSFFNEFKVDTDIRFDNIDYGIKDLKQFTIDGFEGMDKKIDTIESNLIKKIDQTKDEDHAEPESDQSLQRPTG